MDGSLYGDTLHRRPHGNISDWEFREFIRIRSLQMQNYHPDEQKSWGLGGDN
jgi:hypothetical protein